MNKQSSYSSAKATAVSGLAILMLLAVCVLSAKTQSYKSYPGFPNGTDYSSYRTDQSLTIHPFVDIPDYVEIVEGDYYYLEFSAQRIMNKSPEISLLSGHNYKDALIDLGEGQALFYLEANHKLVDSVLDYIIAADYGKNRLIDTITISILNRPLEIVSQLPDNQNELLINQKPIIIRFNEPVDPKSVKKSVQISDSRGEEFNYYYSPDEYAIYVDFDDVFLPELDTINIVITSDLHDLAGHKLENPQVIEYITGPKVYPGDANNDGIVDDLDIIAICKYWKFSGPGRPDAFNSDWLPNAAESWSNAEAVYADVDGNGVIGAEDVCGIIHNWGKFSGEFSLGNLSHDRDFKSYIREFDQDLIQELYTNVIQCPENDGRNFVEAALKSYLFDNRDNLPDEFRLHQNYPNPFNPETIIDYYVPHDCQITLAVYNIIGQKVIDLYEGHAGEGFGSVIWKGQDNLNQPVASGIYFYRLETEDMALTKRMILIR